MDAPTRSSLACATYLLEAGGSGRLCNHVSYIVKPQVLTIWPVGGSGPSLPIRANLV
jgi:hypothetical protein